jgi:two-component system CheB/CheR fusion protein
MAQSDLPAMRVLVVEDNRDAAESLSLLLEIRGHQVAIAHDGAEGLKAARAFEPDVIISDLGLPVLDGFGLARALRADGRLRLVRLIALSGYDRREEALAAGFDDQLVKPGELDDLDRAMRGEGVRRRTRQLGARPLSA